MALQRVGLVGWRGMVGSVLLERMRQEGDLEGLHARFFSTSQAGRLGPDLGGGAEPLRNAHDAASLGECQAVVTCQGSDYTDRILPELRAAGWDGYWIDAASAMRMKADSVIVLDPVNRKAIERALTGGIKTYIGGNCTVSLLLIALAGLFARGWVRWLSSMTYQAASGAGARQLCELVRQMHAVGAACAELLADPAATALDLDRRVTAAVRGDDFPTAELGAPLAASLIPWIDRPVEGGQSREEWKGYAEANKILAASPPIPIDGICVRVGAMRCHSQAVTIRLTQDVPLDEIEAAIAEAHPWVRLVPNSPEATKAQLSPAAVSGRLEVPVGRIRKLRMGPEYLTAFTVGDQLLWGAAEPLRRVLRMIREREG